MNPPKQPKTPLPPIQPLENTSPAGAFVSVFTPTDQIATPSTEEVDINGIKIGAWAGELKDRDIKSPYFWSVCCCPCVPVAQLEVRLGWASYHGALLRQLLSYSVFFAFFVATVFTLGRLVTGVPVLCPLVFFLLCLLVTSVLIARRIGKLRSEVRQRYQIPGTEKDDHYVAFMHTSRAIRQMGKHLQCDRAYFRGAPTTLQAYQV